MEQTLTGSYVIGRPTTGEQVGNYLLLHELGRGGYAQVYLAEHLYLKHLVALKLLNLSLNMTHSFILVGLVGGRTDCVAPASIAPTDSADGCLHSSGMPPLPHL